MELPEVRVRDNSPEIPSSVIEDCFTFVDDSETDIYAFQIKIEFDLIRIKNLSLPNIIESTLKIQVKSKRNPRKIHGKSKETPRKVHGKSTENLRKIHGKSTENELTELTEFTKITELTKLMDLTEYTQLTEITEYTEIARETYWERV